MRSCVLSVNNCKGTRVAHTGYIDWRRMTQSGLWINTAQGTTFVYAFWLADYPDPPAREAGLSLLRADDAHPDWFCAGPRVDQILHADVHPKDVVSPNLGEVFENGLYSRPLLAALCLGSASATYASADVTRYWWAHPDDLVRKGTQLVKDANTLYGRKPVIVTFLDFAPIGQVVPGALSGTATVAKAPGH